MDERERESQSTTVLNLVRRSRIDKVRMPLPESTRRKSGLQLHAPRCSKRGWKIPEGGVTGKLSVLRFNSWRCHKKLLYYLRAVTSASSDSAACVIGHSKIYGAILLMRCNNRRNISNHRFSSSFLTALGPNDIL